MNRTGRLFCLFLVLVLLVSSLSLSSFAALEEHLAEPSKFLVRVCVYIEFSYPDGSYGGYATSSGTGILVGSNGEMQGVVTNASVCGGSKLWDYADALVEEYGFAEYNIGRPQIILEGGGQISADIGFLSESEDIAVLKLETSVYVPGELSVRSGNTLVNGEKVNSVMYAENYDGVYELSSDEGTVKGWEEYESDGEEYLLINHTAPVDATAQGGFLIDSEGAVLGMITAYADGVTSDSSFAVSSQSISRYCSYFHWSSLKFVDAPDDLILGETEAPSSEGTASVSHGLFGRIISYILEGYGISLPTEQPDSGINDVPDYGNNGALRFEIPTFLKIAVVLVFILGFVFFAIIAIILAVVIVVLVRRKKNRANTVEAQVTSSASDLHYE